MTKKELMQKLQEANKRIEMLENVICPAHMHDWHDDYVERVSVCKKCFKLVPMFGD